MDRNLKTIMDKTRFWLRSLVEVMPRYTLDLVDKVATESGVYVFFNNGKPFKVGSSTQLATRIKAQRKEILESIARSIANERSVPINKKCSGCNSRTNHLTEEYKKILKSVRKVTFGFIPESESDKFSMGMHQLEGLLMWSIEPKGNGWIQESDRLGIRGRKNRVGF